MCMRTSEEAFPPSTRTILDEDYPRPVARCGQGGTNAGHAAAHHAQIGFDDCLLGHAA